MEMSTTAERRESEGEPVSRAAWALKASSFQSINLNDSVKDSMETNSPAGEMKTNSPAGKPLKGKKGKAVRVFFRRMCKAVTRPFVCSGSDRVVRLSAQTEDAHLDDPEVTPVPGPSAAVDPAVPELLCLPGQVCDDLKLPSSYVPCSSRIIEQTPDPESSALNLSHKKVKKGRKRKAVRSFFWRACKAVKQLFPCCDQDRVQPPKAEPDLDQSQLVLPEQEQVSADLQSSPEEEAPPEMQALDPVLLSSVSGSVSSPASGSASGSVSSIKSEVTPDTEASDPEIDLPQGSVVSLFEVGHMITSGNFSKVYEGTHLFSNKVKVALKCIPKRRADRYLDIPGHSKPLLVEVALMLRLGEAPSCPNIIQLHQRVEDESSFTLIMEYPEPCRTLEDYILFFGPVSEAQARLFMVQVLEAVKHCHKRGVYHGDIRSRNILVTLPSLELKLIDFRCARLISSEGFNSSEYQGSDAYTPPEVLMRSVFHAAEADVWALAVLLFEIIHRYLPFESFDAIQHGYLRMDPTLSSAYHDLIFHCLSRNPAHRLTLQQLEEHRWMKAWTG